MTTDMEPTNYRLAEKPKRRFTWILGLFIPTMVVLPLWFFFIGPRMRHDRLVEHGIKASGRLLAVEETGTVVNDSPELELTVEFRRSDGVLDTATTDFVPSLRSLHLFQPGVSVTAAYDAEDPEEITVVDLSTGAAPSIAPVSAPSSSSVDSLQHVADSLRSALEELRSH